MASSVLTSELFSQGKLVAERLIAFVNQSPTPFHAVDNCVKKLEENGFQRLSERQTWTLKTSGKYYFTRNNSSIIAFAVGGKYQTSNGLKIIGAHTDSPNLQIKPVSATTKAGFQQISVTTYGGGLWHTWFDRDLTLAGRVMVRDGDALQSRLINVKRPILRIPNLAIHLTDDRAKFTFNKEDHLCPILCSSIVAALEGKKDEASKEQKHHAVLLNIIAQQLDCKVEDIADFELSVCDSQPAQLGGAFEELVFSPRLDNLCSCFASLEAISSCEGLEEDPQCRVMALYDHEEVGSESANGAGSTHVQTLLDRLSKSFGGESSDIIASRSFMLSADLAHAVHPNYAGKHHDLHRPEIHKGVTLKFNCNQRYATNGLSAAIVRELARRHQIPLQDFAPGNEMPCGTTIGPILSTHSGIRTVDLGIAQWSMHSIRETCGTTDVMHYVNLFKAFYFEFHKVDVVDGE